MNIHGRSKINKKTLLTLLSFIISEFSPANVRVCFQIIYVNTVQYGLHAYLLAWESTFHFKNVKAYLIGLTHILCTIANMLISQNLTVCFSFKFNSLRNTVRLKLQIQESCVVYNNKR